MRKRESLLKKDKFGNIRLNKPNPPRIRKYRLLNADKYGNAYLDKPNKPSLKKHRLRKDLQWDIMSDMRDKRATRLFVEMKSYDFSVPGDVQIKTGIVIFNRVGENKLGPLGVFKPRAAISGIELFLRKYFPLGYISPETPHICTFPSDGLFPVASADTPDYRRPIRVTEWELINMQGYHRSDYLEDEAKRISALYNLMSSDDVTQDAKISAVNKATAHARANDMPILEKYAQQIVLE